MDLKPSILDNIKLLEFYQSLQWFVEVARLEEGQAFGELALQNNLNSAGEHTGLRKATIMCLTECYFATIDKISYNKVLAKEK
jgi:hypothetical protein